MNNHINQFDYDISFSRNIGWITQDEQDKLKNSRVAIAGLGGVGGSHAMTMARMGVGKFTISDFDTFDWPNLNRQAGAFASTMGKSKLDVLSKILRDINPDINIKVIPGGVNCIVRPADLVYSAPCRRTAVSKIATTLL